MNEKKRKYKLSLSIFKMPRKYDSLLNIIMIVLIIFGSIMLLSVSIKDASFDRFAIYRILARQLLFFIAGYIAMFFLAKTFTLKRAQRYAFPMIIICIILLIMCLFFDDGYGIKAWIKIPTPFIPITIQPSELNKLALIVFFSVVWGGCSTRVNLSPSDVFVLPLILFAISGFIIMKFQDDFGSFAINVFIVGILSLMPIHSVFTRYKITVRIGIVVVCALAVFLCFSPLGLSALLATMGEKNYMYQRFAMARNPFADTIVSGYQLVNGLVAFNSGGWSGKGLGNSIYKYDYVPASATDSILSIVVEELGIFGFVFILICYLLIIYKLFAYATKMKNLTAKMILVGIGSYFFIHFALNVGGVSVLIPMTGIPLIFVSSGGSAMMTGMMSIGIAQALISAYRRGEI